MENDFKKRLTDKMAELIASAGAKVKAYPFDEFYRGYEEGLKDALMEIEGL